MIKNTASSSICPGNRGFDCFFDCSEAKKTKCSWRKSEPIVFFHECSEELLMRMCVSLWNEVVPFPCCRNVK